MTDLADLHRRFNYHKPDAAKGVLHQTVRDAAKQAAYDFSAILPEGREKSLALTKLEEAMFWANAAIARDQG